jgi:exonuclease-1
MGIRGLTHFLKTKGACANLPVVWTAGQSWGVDCSCLMFRARASKLSIVTVIAGLVVRMRSAGIEPIMVFDGRSPVAKAPVIAARRVVREKVQKELSEIERFIAEKPDMSEMERATLDRRTADLQEKAPRVNTDDKNELKKFLYAAGIQFVTATEEADDVLAFLCRQGTIQAVVSTDTDMLARGVPILIVPVSMDSTVLTQIRLDGVLACVGRTYTEFVDACMMMGSDYSGEGWRGMDVPTALERARGGVTWTDISGCDPVVMEAGVRMLRGDGVTWEAIVPDKQRVRWATGAPAKEPENLVAIATALGWPRDWINILS